MKIIIGDDHKRWSNQKIHNLYDHLWHSWFGIWSEATWLWLLCLWSTLALWMYQICYWYVPTIMYFTFNDQISCHHLFSFVGCCEGIFQFPFHQYFISGWHPDFIILTPFLTGLVILFLKLFKLGSWTFERMFTLHLVSHITCHMSRFTYIFHRWLTR